MHPVKIYDSVGSPVTGTDTGEVFELNKARYQTGSVQVDFISGTGSVQVQGRVVDQGGWENLLDPAASSDKVYPASVVLLPYMRVRISTATDLEVQVWRLEH